MPETLGAIAIRALIVGFIMSLVVITGFAYSTLLERKLLARFQARMGPKMAGYIPIPGKNGQRKFLRGFMLPAADAVKMFFKEDLAPKMIDPVVFNLAPMLTVASTVLMLAVIPWTTGFEIFGIKFDGYFAIAPGIKVGVLFVLGVTSLAVYGPALAGWSSNSKYAILGGIRSTAQMISYELALSLSVLPPVMLAGSMNLNDIVTAQSPWLTNVATGAADGGIWYVVYQPVATIIFIIGVFAELQRAPFDLLEAEQELASGYAIEYGGMRFGMFFMAEYMKMIIFSALIAIFFFGGYSGPFVDSVPALGFVYLFAKIFAFLVLMVWVRASYPRLRYDQLMNFGWKVLLPVSVLNVIVTAIVIVLRAEGYLSWLPF